MPSTANARQNLQTMTTSVPALSKLTSTSLATKIGAVTREVMKRGAVIITRHDAPVMVLISMDRYAELERAAAPHLAALTSRFDAMYARMQQPEVGERTIAALDLNARTTRRGRSATTATSGHRGGKKQTLTSR